MNDSMKRPISLGIDLAGSEKRPTGLCVLDSRLNAITWVVKLDNEIIQAVEKWRPEIVAIDAPLSLPKQGALRECDKELLRRGIRLLPPAAGPMLKLTLRGIRLCTELRSRGFKVIEVFPGGAQDVLGIPRKRAGKDRLLAGLRKLGIKQLRDNITLDELDAVTAAYVGLLYLRHQVEIIGGCDGYIVMPASTRGKARS